MIEKKLTTPEGFATPVLLMIFNRPDTTRAVFERLRELRPSRLFIAADGPRANRPDDAKNCAEARAVTEKIDWPCEVKRLYRENNLGCRFAPSGAVSWFFDNVEEGIIIEDDTLADLSFFRMCDELLPKYRKDERIMHISGDNINLGRDKNFKCDNSYFFSIIPQMWGWASWSRAWKYYDVNMEKWPEIKESGVINTRILDKSVQHTIIDLIDQYYHGKNSWDGQWIMAIMEKGGICINPHVNLVTNIGFDERATHTKDSTGKFSELKTYSLPFPLRHPKKVEVNREADQFLFKHQFGINLTFKQTLKNFFKIYFPSIYSLLKRSLH